MTVSYQKKDKEIKVRKIDNDKEMNPIIQELQMNLEQKLQMIKKKLMKKLKQNQKRVKKN